MSAIELAIVSGLIAFLAKIGFDIRIEHQARKAVAAALAGEMCAYLRLSQPEKTASESRLLLALLFEERQKCLTGNFSLPSGHPVFDQVADKIGILTPQAAQGVSEAYNIFTLVRLALILIGSETFLHVPDTPSGGLYDNDGRHVSAGG